MMSRLRATYLYLLGVTDARSNQQNELLECEGYREDKS
jgi:hypothetical protein